jgi:hypothetical protein
MDGMDPIDRIDREAVALKRDGYPFPTPHSPFPALPFPITHSPLSRAFAVITS